MRIAAEELPSAYLLDLPESTRFKVASESFSERWVVPGRWVCQTSVWLWDAPIVPPKPGEPSGFLVPCGAESGVFRAESGGFRVVEAGPGDRVLRSLARCCHGSLASEGGFLAYHQTLEVPDVHDLEQGERVFLVLGEGRAVGFAVGRDLTGLSLRVVSDVSGFRKAECRLCPLPEGERLGGVDVLWLASSYRGRGLGKLFLRGVAASYGVGVSEMVYGLPMTREGFRLVRSQAGSVFYAAGQFVQATVLESEEGRLCPCDVREVFEGPE